MIKKIVQRFSLFKKILIFTGLFSLHQNCIMAAIPSLLNKERHQVTEQDKALQIRVVGISDAFTMLLHKIGIRVAGLKLSPQERAAIQLWLTEMKESLKIIKSRQSLHIQTKQLTQAVIILSEVIKGVETSLQNALKTSPEIDSSAIKRSSQEITFEELDKILTQTEKRLKSFDKLINNINKTAFNRFYTWISDHWNTPLYSFTELPIEENQNIYISSILKRIAIYGAGLGLIVRNLPQNHIDAIPSDFIKNWLVQPVKNIVGGASFTAQVTTEDKGIPVNPVPTDNNLYFGNIDTCSQIIQKNSQGFPTITDIHGNPLPVIWKNGNYQVDLSFLTDEENKSYTELHLVLKDGSTLEITRNDIEKIISNGDMWALPAGGIIKRVADDVYVDLTTGKNILLSKEMIDNVLKDKNQIGHFDIKSPYSYNTHPVPPALILNKDTKGIPTSTTTTKSIDQLDEKGFFIRLIGNFNWITPLELTKISFQIPVAAYVCSTIYNDVKNIGKIIPHLAAKTHKNLRGEGDDRFKKVEAPKDTFDDIVGRTAHKKALQPLIDFVSNPTGFIQADIAIPRGWLFAGEPQTGKTSMVKAIAGELSKNIKEHQGINRDVKVYTISVDHLLEHGLQVYLQILKDQAPCILFCDEFDLIGAQRDQNKRFLAEALQALGGYTTSSDLQELVLFIIATNRPENIDYALRADGRCGKTLYFENPYFQDRKNYFESFFKKKMMDPQAFDLNAIAQETENCSYGTLKAISSEIIRLGLSENVLPSQKQANLAIDSIVKKIIQDDDAIPAHISRVLAARYAAKALASVVLDPKKAFACATILKITNDIKEKPVNYHFQAIDEGVSGIRFGQLFCYHTGDSYELVSQQEMLKACKIAVAGLEGQRVLGFDYTTYAEDEQEALKLARQIVFNGVEEKYLPRQVLQEKYMQAYLLVESCKQEMRQLLTENKAYYSKLATLLEHRKTIRMPAIKECFGKDLLLLKARYANMQIPDFVATVQAAAVKHESDNQNLIDQEEQALVTHA